MRLRFTKSSILLIVFLLTAEFIVSGVGFCGHHHHQEDIEESMIHHELLETDEDHEHHEDHSDTCDHHHDQCRCTCLGNFVAVHETIQISFSLDFSEPLLTVQPSYQSELSDNLFRPPIQLLFS